MGLPVPASEFLADQRIARRRIGDAEQRLGEAHQRHAFLAREREFVDQPLDAAPPPLGAQRLHQAAGERFGPCLARRIGGQVGKQGGHRFGLRHPKGPRDRRARRRQGISCLLAPGRVREIGEKGGAG